MPQHDPSPALFFAGELREYQVVPLKQILQNIIIGHIKVKPCSNIQHNMTAQGKERQPTRLICNYPSELNKNVSKFEGCWTGDDQSIDEEEDLLHCYETFDDFPGACTGKDIISMLSSFFVCC